MIELKAIHRAPHHFPREKKIFFRTSLRRGLHLLRVWVLLLTPESISSPSRLELREMEKTAHFPKHFLIHLFAAHFRLSTAQCPRKGFVCHFPRGLDCSMADNRSILPHETIFSFGICSSKLSETSASPMLRHHANCDYICILMTVLKLEFKISKHVGKVSSRRILRKFSKSH